MARGLADRFELAPPRTSADRKQCPSEWKRAEVIVGGAPVLATTMSELGLSELLVSERDIFDGLAPSLR